MSTLLSKLMEEVSKLPEIQQNELAAHWLEDLKDDLRWEQSFASSQDQLAKLADQALKDFKEGRTKNLGFDEL